jgi:hypothetical protein
MYVRLIRRACASGILVFLLTGGTASAQDAAHQHGDDAQAQGQDHQHDMSAMGGISMTRDGSGTSWLPDETPMYALHRQANDWMLMLHANGFLQYLKDTGDRGSDQFGSINWVMGMAQRKVGAGQLMLRGMMSAEPGTIRGCGYPDLLATGEECEGEAIHDRQHPHDLFMELAAQYSRPIGRGIQFHAYAGPVGEPALGPVAFMHRVSALSNLLAPITHHWFDSTHITYGVATGGVFSSKWKAEASVFNGREPDEDRTNFDFAAMDSWSARFWFLPTSHLALQVSGGHLKEAEAGHDGGPRRDVDRITASATFHRATLENTFWATTIGWGRNKEPDEATNAFLVESSVTLHDRDALYGRFEWAQKSGHNLVVEPGDDIFSLAKLQGGYTRYLEAWKGWTPGVGGSLSFGIVPESLRPVYGSRVNTGFSVYLTLRPRPMTEAARPGGGQ